MRAGCGACPIVGRDAAITRWSATRRRPRARTARMAERVGDQRSDCVLRCRSSANPVRSPSAQRFRGGESARAAQRESQPTRGRHRKARRRDRAPRQADRRARVPNQRPSSANVTMRCARARNRARAPALASTATSAARAQQRLHGRYGHGACAKLSGRRGAGTAPLGDRNRSDLRTRTEPAYIGESSQ